MIRPREGVRPVSIHLEPFRPEHWTERAACIGTDPEAFYPDGKGRHVPEAVKRICGSCEVRRDCLDHAIATNDPWGVFGGVSPRDRRGKQPGDDVPIRFNRKRDAS